VSSHDEVKPIPDPAAATAATPEADRQVQEEPEGARKGESGPPKPRSRISVPKPAPKVEENFPGVQKGSEPPAKQIGHPDKAAATLTGRLPDDDDNNFMIESDNVDDNLYSRCRRFRKFSIKKIKLVTMTFNGYKIL
jgi:hypothetical protein